MIRFCICYYPTFVLIIVCNFVILLIEKNCNRTCIYWISYGHSSQSPASKHVHAEKRLTGRTRLKLFVLAKQTNCQIAVTKTDVTLHTIQHVRKYVFFLVLLYKICLHNRIAIRKQSDEKPFDKFWMVQVLFWLQGFSSLSPCSLHLTLNRILFLMIGSSLLLCLRLLSMWCYVENRLQEVLKNLVTRLHESPQDSSHMTHSFPKSVPAQQECKPCELFTLEPYIHTGPHWPPSHLRQIIQLCCTNYSKRGFINWVIFIIIMCWGPWKVLQ